MALFLDLPSDLERRLNEAARLKGVTSIQFIAALLDERLPSFLPAEKAIAILQLWINEAESDEDEDDAGYDLIKALEENRRCC